MTGKERAKFRALANTIDPVFQIGKGGMSDALIKQTEDALRVRELIKIKALLESIPESPRELADKLSTATEAEVIQVIGGCIVLYKENPEIKAAAKEKEKRKKEAAKKAKLKAKLSDASKKGSPTRRFSSGKTSSYSSGSKYRKSKQQKT